MLLETKRLLFREMSPERRGGTSETTLFVPKIQCESVMLFFLFFLHVMLRVPVE